MNIKRRERFKKTGKRVGRAINPRAWMGYDHLKKSTLFLKNEFNNVFVPPSPGEQNDFEEVVENFNLTPKELLEKQKTFLFLAIFLVFLMLIVLGYALYQLIHAHYLSFFPSFVLSLFCLSLAFRYHFWYFQVKSRKLGCTLQEWLEFLLSKKQSSEKNLPTRRK